MKVTLKTLHATPSKIEKIKCNKCKCLIETKEILEENVAIPSFYCKKLKCQLLNGYMMLHCSKTCGENLK